MIITIIFFVLLLTCIVIDSFFIYPGNEKIKSKIDKEKYDKK